MGPKPYEDTLMWSEPLFDFGEMSPKGDVDGWMDELGLENQEE